MRYRRGGTLAAASRDFTPRDVVARLLRNSRHAMVETSSCSRDAASRASSTPLAQAIEARLARERLSSATARRSASDCGPARRAAPRRGGARSALRRGCSFYAARRGCWRRCSRSSAGWRAASTGHQRPTADGLNRSAAADRRHAQRPSAAGQSAAGSGSARRSPGAQRLAATQVEAVEGRLRHAPTCARNWRRPSFFTTLPVDLHWK